MRLSIRRRARVAVFLIGAAVLFGITFHAGMDPVLHILGTLRPAGLAAIVLLHLPVIAMMGLAWWCVGRDSGRPILFMGARLVRDSVAEALPFSQIGGFLSGLRLLVLAGTNMVDGAIAMFADLLIEFYAKLLYTLLGVAVLIWLHPGDPLIRPFSIALICLLAMATAFLLFEIRFKVVLGRLLQWGLGKSGLLPHDANIEAGFSRILARKPVLVNFAIHAGCWLFGAVEAWVTLRLMGISVSGAQALVIDSLATAFRILGFLIPAALGVQEAGYVLVCGLFGISPAAAIAFSLARRARDLLCALAGLAIWQGVELQAYRRSEPSP